MVTNETRGSREVFVCEDCRMAYPDQETAQKCEDWCKEFKSCNLDIIKHAIRD